MPFIRESIQINASRETVYALASDMEQYPTFMPDVESVTVIDRSENTTTTEWVTNVEGTPIIWTEEDTFHRKQFVILYRLIEGDLDKFDGQWIFEVSEFLQEGVLVPVTTVTLEVDYDFGIPNLTELIGPTLDIKVRENSQMMLKGMKEHIESLGATGQELINAETTALPAEEANA